MTKDETAAAVAKTLSTGALAAFGLTWWTVIAAVLGAFASLHFEEPATGSSVSRVLLQIFALALLSGLLAVALPLVPLFGWFDAVPVAVRAGLLGVFANPVYKLIKARIHRGKKDL